MIPYANIVEWRATTAPWVDDAQVEQDLVLSRAILLVFNDDWLRARLAFRGGTVLHKCLLAPAARYSNDIDLVMTEAGPIGPVFDRLRQVLAWLGEGKTKLSANLGTITFAFATEGRVPPSMKLKVEINYSEHEPLFGFHSARYEIQNTWCTGMTSLRTYELDELLGTKLRALHQRRKGRDLFDLDLALRRESVSPERIRAAFLHYMQSEPGPLYRHDVEATLAAKMTNDAFLNDIRPLLRPDVVYNAREAYERVGDTLITPLPRVIIAPRTPPATTTASP
jgi:predicted nucleotidyltransferase component of viral defense system